MYFLQLLSGFLLISVAICFTSAGIQIGKDLVTGEARRLGIFIMGVGTLILIICVVVFLSYLGYHGLIGKLQIDLLK